MRITSAITVGLFALAAVILASTIPNLYVLARTDEATADQARADAIAAAIQARPDVITAVFVDTLRLRTGAAHIVLRDARGAVLAEAGVSPAIGRSETRTVDRGRTVQVEFDHRRLSRAVQTLRVASAAGGVACLTAILMAIGYAVEGVGRSGRDKRARGETGTDPQREVLFSTFEASIRTMKGRESELRHLHDLERARANELASVTATLVRSMTSGFISINESGLLLDLNQSARELLRIPFDEPIAGRSIAEVLGDGAFGRELAAAVSARKPLQREEITEDPERPLIIGVSTVPLFDETNRYFGMLALFADLTPLRTLEERLRVVQALADVGEVAAGIAHEFRTSLATILGYIRLARKETLPPAADQRLRNAEEEARLVTEGVEKLLSLTRPFTLNRESVDLTSLLESIIGRLAALHPSIRFTLNGKSAFIEGDAALLTRAFENLIRNSVEAIAEREGPGTVTVDVRATPEPRIEIRDDGAGLDDREAARLLLPFQSRKAQGFGLGLFLVSKIVLLHGGTFRLTGKPGIGATAIVDFTGSAAIQRQTRDRRSE
jgi:signal transduction histidine kinase